MTLQKALALISSLGAAWLCASDSHAAPLPDPKLLIQGVESSRLQIQPSRLHLERVFSNAVSVNKMDMKVAFDGDRRQFEYVSTPEAQRSFFDGKQVALFDGRELTMRDLSDDSSDPLFDPRVIGLTQAYSWVEALNTVLPHDENAQFEMIGLEPIHGDLSYHVKASFKAPTPYQIDLWISQANDFKVYRYDTTFPGGHTTAISYYQNTNYPWLPSKVESHSYNPEGKLRFSDFLTVVSAEVDSSLPETTWTVAGLHLPAGTWISDRRTMLKDSKWDGSKVVKIAPRSHAQLR